MKLLKLIVVIFIIHFVRRFFQMARALKMAKNQAQAQAEKEKNPPQPQRPDVKVVDAEFKVLDP